MGLMLLVSFDLPHFVDEQTEALMDGVLVVSGGVRNVTGPPTSKACAINALLSFSVLPDTLQEDFNEFLQPTQCGEHRVPLVCSLQGFQSTSMPETLGLWPSAWLSPQF